GNVRRDSRGDGIEGMMRKVSAIHHRTPAENVGYTLPGQRCWRMSLEQSRIACGDQRLQGNASQLVDLRRAEVELVKDGAGQDLRALRDERAQERPTLHDSAMKESLRRRHCHEGAHFATSAGLAEDGDVVPVAAEVAYVVAHPLERSDNVEHAQVRRGRIRLAELGEVEESQGTQPVIERDDHTTSAPAQPYAFIG